MNSQKAKTQAKYLTGIRKITHVIIKNGNEFYVEIAKNFKGKAYETVEYKEAVEESKAETKAKKESKKVQDIQDLPGPTDQEIL